MTKRANYVVFIAVLCFMCIVVVLNNLWQKQAYPRRLMHTNVTLLLAKDNIRRFKDMEGRYPFSLGEINQYAQIHPATSFCRQPFGEDISKKYGNMDEHTSLNGLGGLYYNAETGEVRVNLTKSVGDYMPFYLGSKRNEIPADW